MATEETKELEETSKEQLKRLERKMVYMQAELDGMDSREAKRRESRKQMIAFMLGFCYALLLVSIIKE